MQNVVADHVTDSEYQPNNGDTYGRIGLYDEHDCSRL